MAPDAALGCDGKMQVMATCIWVLFVNLREGASSLYLGRLTSKLAFAAICSSVARCGSDASAADAAPEKKCKSSYCAAFSLGLSLL